MLCSADCQNYNRLSLLMVACVHAAGQLRGGDRALQHCSQVPGRESAQRSFEVVRMPPETSAVRHFAFQINCMKHVWRSFHTKDNFVVAACM